MKVIVKPDTEIFRLWNKQVPSENIKYRPIKYLRHVVDDGDYVVILENMMTIEVIAISIEEYKAMFEDTLKYTDKILYTYLISHWFLIPENMDEYSMVRIYRNSTRPTKIFDSYINQFVVLTTTGCNARCYYCYEQNSKHISMTDKVAKDVAAYIMDKKDPNTDTHIRWFGGEPLCNTRAIDIISQEFKNNGIGYWCSMISNGYAFTKEMIEKAVSLWRLRRIQITLDGTQSIYNSTKNYQVKYEGDPFYRVIDNIQTLLENNVNVSIRMNVDDRNKDNLYELIDYLNDRFKDYKDGSGRLTMYPTPLFEGPDPGFVQRTSENRKDIYKSCIDLENYIRGYGFTARKPQIKANTIYNTTQCMADYPLSQLIVPDGSLGVCEHHIEDSFFGSIYTSARDRDWSEALKFLEHADEYPECRDCFYYPRCIRLKLCPTNALCNEAVRMDKEYLIDLSLHETYKSYKAKLNGGSNENTKI